MNKFEYTIKVREVHSLKTKKASLEFLSLLDTSHTMSLDHLKYTFKLATLVFKLNPRLKVTQLITHNINNLPIRIHDLAIKNKVVLDYDDLFEHSTLVPINITEYSLRRILTDPKIPYDTKLPLLKIYSNLLDE